jgi:K+ transporter
VSLETVMGAVSPILRLLILFASLKCAILILRADNHGEAQGASIRAPAPQSSGVIFRSRREPALTSR